MSATTRTAIDRNTINQLYAMYGLPVIGGGEQTPEEIAAAEAEAKRLADEEAAEAEKLKLGEAGKETLRKERDARKAAEKAAKDANDRIAALEAKQAEADAAKAQADEADAIKRGEFEKLAGERAETIKGLTGERDGYKSQLDTLIAAIKPDVDEQWKALPEEVSELYTGEADDTLARRAFMAIHRKLIDKLTATKEQQNEALRKVPTTPRPNGNGDPVDAAIDQQRRSGKYKV